jgi:redox-sensitive bicupin YhaK (pirin superfamily)
MSNINLVIEERAASIGKFMVGRLLPFRQKRMVGPFIYLDHMGPVQLNEHENFDVLPHPHIGLSTLTYLLDGTIMHRDSIGNEVEITPGAVNWMTAGKGIVHSERTPQRLRNQSKSMHGLQIWVALPKHLENMKPEFFHIDASHLPEWYEQGVHFKLIAGEVFGRKSAVPVYSNLFLIEIKSQSAQKLNIGNELFGESGLYILHGGIETEGNQFAPKQLLVASESKLCEFTIEANSTIYIFGGDAFPEKRFIDWNFVSSDMALIEQAREKWKAGKFDTIHGETEYMPYPERK